jgi:hypothetical protein
MFCAVVSIRLVNIGCSRPSPTQTFVSAMLEIILVTTALSASFDSAIDAQKRLESCLAQSGPANCPLIFLLNTC